MWESIVGCDAFQRTKTIVSAIALVLTTRSNQERRMATTDLSNSRTALQDPRRKYPSQCQHCQSFFLGLRPTHKYCTQACQEAAYQAPRKQCAYCGNAFRARGTKRQYCSLACWYATRRDLFHDANGAEQAFWALVDTSPHPQGCWIWQGYTRKHKMNYGEFRRTLVHRYSYQLAHPDEQITPDDLILHTCDNCPCVRPTHLFKGTYLDNNRDAVAKGRHAKLTDALVREILAVWRQGGITQRALAQRYHISPPVMCNILQRKAWKHIQEDHV
jgi:ferredoxin